MVSVVGSGAPPASENPIVIRPLGLSETLMLLMSGAPGMSGAVSFTVNTTGVEATAGTAADGTAKTVMVAAAIVSTDRAVLRDTSPPWKTPRIPYATIGCSCVG